MQISRVDLKDAADEAEFGKRLIAFDRKMPRDRWLLGGEWDHDRAFNGVLPTAELLDTTVNGSPAFFASRSGPQGGPERLEFYQVIPEPSGGATFGLSLLALRRARARGASKSRREPCLIGEAGGHPELD